MGGVGSDQQQQQQTSEGQRWAQGWNLSGNQNAQAQQSTGVSQSQSGSFIDPTQLGFLTQLWGDASRVANPAAAAATAGRTAATTMPGLRQAFGALGGLTNPNRQVAAQGASLRAGLGHMFREEINPAITSGAIASGGFGGGRQGVAQGVAAGQLGDTFAKGLGDIVAGANRTAVEAGGQLGGLAETIQNLGMGGINAGLGQLSGLAGILGNPAVLQQLLSSTVNQSSGVSSGSGFGMGAEKSGGWESGQSTGSKSGWNFNLLPLP